ncbi:pentapeptide repeat-containing protein [Bifidobacterium cuniculi]|uniref:Pentapeptide repeat-containing protein n=1 Tax=Bifidobacterium cuniculi TaxID=1688 RepID=A0A087ANE2_9BIFI|nr:hypothetical protein [Bifidobacterium cuniculi]KFI60292.1 hypothetical protein BCUN_1456 [Bifidobacterium cuniculi]
MDSRIVAPHITSTTQEPPTLTDSAPAISINRESTYDGMRFTVPTASDSPIRNLHGLLCTFLDCAFPQLRADHADLDQSHVQHCSFDTCSVTELSAVRAQYGESLFTGCRIGAFDAMDASWTSIIVENCRIGYLNLRAATWRDVAFRDCIIDDFDAADARLTRVAFPGTAIGRLSTRHARLEHVDLRGAQLRQVEGVEHLCGVTMDAAQVADLAQAFAENLGIRVD